MTREEREDAINFLKGYLDEEVYTEKCRNAHEMAIKSLEKEPCEDAINREDTMTALRADLSFICPGDQLNAIRIVEGMPPVNPQPKTGHWIPMGLVDSNDNRNYECSECHHGDTHAKNQIVPYCWYCGTKMESEDKE